MTSDIYKDVEAATTLLEGSHPGGRAWEDAISALRTSAEADAVPPTVAALDPPTARRYLTAHAIAATLRAREARTTRKATKLLEELRALLGRAKLEPTVTLRLAQVVADAATSLQRLEGPLDDVRQRVWAACFGASLYEARWHWLDLRDQSVLVLGETGTGKELVAQTLGHANTWFEHTVASMPARQRPTAPPRIAFNVAALPSATAEGELFGWERGAFTGAEQARRGHIERAHGGTIFLDEIGDLPSALFPKLLRAIAAHEVLPLGGDAQHPREVHARWVTATSRPIARMAADGSFTEDLRRRLSGYVIEMTPLRAWDLDAIRLLARRHAVARAADDGTTGQRSPTYVSRTQERFDRELGRWLLERRRAWPGNVRQLLQLVSTWKVQGAAQARRNLDEVPSLDDAPEHPAPHALEPRTVPQPIREGRATFLDVTHWYVRHSRGNYESASAHARGLGIDIKTRNDYLKRALAADPSAK